MNGTVLSSGQPTRVVPMTVNPVPPVVATSTEAPVPAVPKLSTSAPQERAKPQPAAPDPAIPNVANAVAPAAADDTRPDFLVTDAAGYSRTLKDYRGYILIFGVWNGKQPRTVASLERVYQTFGPNTKLRILGVANEHQLKPPTATFPIVYNQGSTLLGAKESEFLIVEAGGTVRARGSLLQDPDQVVATIQSALHRLGM